MRSQAAKVSLVLIPEPGMPDTAIKTRCEGGVSLYFAWQQSLVRPEVIGFNLDCMLTPSFLHQLFHLLLHNA